MIVERLVDLMSGRGNLSARGRPVLVPLCPPHIPRDLAPDGTRAAAT
jgi:hypothetical protein